MKYCPFCVGHHAFSEVVLIAHIAKAHSPAYAKLVGIALRIGHQERAKDINMALRQAGV
jgi:hypothetical protein